MSETTDWEQQLRANREEKDRFFAEHPQSPVPPEHRDGFEGLDYFEPNEDFRVAAVAEVHDEPEPVEMETTNGPPVRYLRVATFAFELRGEDCELHAYRQENSEEDTLFVPFRDKTTGQQTYHGGRYMEFEPEGELETGDTVTLDFNLAYSPFCAFSETFSCPLPPEENWLEVVVPAGEKTPELE
ncbi:DUF1684 domain-containing protein [Halolamina litorea]|uniref:DUF1684 domain-containing protein n=1 Tax=Halolamina litorea TaxID=1515593 RepID=A0ABD6BQV9_9EURY|nr:DUF1684 domain-containing protein [Halolamina litorea]